MRTLKIFKFIPYLKIDKYLSAFFVLINLITASSWAQSYGLFMIVKGQVKFQNPNSTMDLAKVGSKVLEGATVITENDSRAKIVMSDRNVVNLSPNSKLIIQKYETTAGAKNVSLQLEEGKIRVNVEQKYDDKTEKFQLKTPTVVAGVRGTQFLAAFDAVTKQSQIVTFKGSVAMTSLNANGQPINTVLVNKGQKSSAGANQATEAPVNLPQEEVRELDKSSSSVTEPKRENSSSGNIENKDKNKNPESSEAKVTNNSDLGTDLAKDIKVVSGPNKEIPLAPRVINPVPIIKPPEFITGAIQNQNSKTKVIITINK